MQAKGKTIAQNRIIHILPNILSSLFWICIIFSFEERSMAWASITSALIHESGHIIYLWMLGDKIRLKGVLSGLRLKPGAMLSYKEQMYLCLCGVLANMITIIVSLPTLLILGNAPVIFIIANAVTAISNLLPIEGYDGYGFIYALLSLLNSDRWLFSLLGSISTLLIFSLCILSLYFIDRHGGGYWFFALFFISMLKRVSSSLIRINNEI